MIGLTQFFGADQAGAALEGIKSIVPVLGTLAIVGMGVKTAQVLAKPHNHDTQPQPTP